MMPEQTKILIVEDDPRMGDLMARQLGTSGYELRRAPDGQTAVKLLEEERDIDVMILDIRLPRINGLEVFELVRERFPHLKIIISSVYAKHEQEFLIHGADGYFFKTDGMTELTRCVEQLLASVM